MRATTRAISSWFSLALLTALIVGSAPAAASAASPKMTEWTVPYPDSRPRDPSVGRDWRIWFVGQTDNYLGVFNPQSHSFNRIALPTGTRPHSALVGPDGDIWVAGNGNGTLLRYTSDGQLRTTISVPESAGLSTRDPHTLAFDGHGGLWFTMQNGNAVGHLQVDSGELRVVPMKTPQSRPYGLIRDHQGNAWVVLFAGGKLVRIGHGDFQLSEFTLPREHARPRRVAIDSQGLIWYVDYAQDYLGHFDPRSSAFSEWRLPEEQRPAAPYAMAIDASDRVWLFLTAPQPNKVLSFDRARQQFSEAITLQSGGGAVRHAEFHPDSDSIWFGTDRNTLGQLRVSSAADGSSD
ncbi:virginiamycin B lyase family protein [Pseudomarimonas arenosa]|uniref:Lyase n=1 Tax=Pseudomarimonas arenosa TaxID=2774145 RepID=A0AAW3ZPW9_9GAMM|nr:lyase [Pseudomarimonas arenosa]MBD8526341.1 lyase [Pseudomarimonas arenosa]